MSTLEFEVLTLFPEAIEGFCQAGLLGRAIEDGRVNVRCTNPRDFATDRHRTVDDAPFGGGAGMVMKIGPVVASLESAEQTRGPMHKILLTPSAPQFDQRAAERLAKLPRIALLCGRYEGIDDRVRENFVDECLSVGDYILNGGEVAALAIIEAVTRLREGVLGNPESVAHESHAVDDSGALLEHPHYTRPATFRGLEVPPVLLSGNHAAISRWRGEQARTRTWSLRPELRSVERLPEHVPLYLGMNTDAAPEPDEAWAEVAHARGLEGIIGVGDGSAGWTARWAEALRGRVPVAGLSSFAKLRRQLRRGHGGEVSLVTHRTGALARSAESLLDHCMGLGQGALPGSVVLWVGPHAPPEPHAEFALPDQASLALPVLMDDSPQPWPAGAAILADGALAHIRGLWTGKESLS
jgi:tRNA (guanine-N1)-methyltransferase